MDTITTVAAASSPAVALTETATESFVNDKNLTADEKKMMKRVEMLVRIIAAILGVFAFSLSWQCNRDTPTFLRIVYATVAFFMGGTYLLYYFFFRGECGLLLSQEK